MDKILQLLERAERKLSDMVMVLWALVLRPVHTLNKIIFPILGKISEFAQNLLRDFINTIIRFVQFLNSTFGPRAWSFYKHKFTNFVNKVKQEKAEKIKLKMEQSKPGGKAGTQTTASAIPVAAKANAWKEFMDWIDALFQKLSEVSPTKFATMGFLFLVIMLNTFHFLTTSTDLVTTITESHSEKVRREIASTMEQIPIYYNDLARLSSIKGLKIPAYNFKTDKIKSLEVDTNILFYNRSAKKFFDDNMIIFIDHLEMTLEPVQPSFPLTPEGRTILKQKIKYEIDSMLREFDIESHVENVFFTNVFAN